MNKQLLPQAPEATQQSGFSFEPSPKALQHWQPELRAEVQDAENTITIFEEIGFNPWTGEGVTAKRISAALRQIGRDQDVTVLINSPGGSVFEGFTIYNLLKDHKGKVTVKILGVAASAASVIAMAGDEILMGDAAFLMIHNAWFVVVGNRHDFIEAARFIEPFDMAMADIYHARTEHDRDAIIKMMDDETYINAKDAIDKGFADGYMHEKLVNAEINTPEVLAIRQVDAAMAKAGIPRSQRRDLVNKIKSGKQDAAGGGMQNATVTDTQDAVAPNLSCAISSAENILNFLKGGSK